MSVRLASVRKYTLNFDQLILAVGKAQVNALLELVYVRPSGRCQEVYVEF
jgi:hypothetical protein